MMNKEAKTGKERLAPGRGVQFCTPRQIGLLIAAVCLLVMNTGLYNGNLVQQSSSSAEHQSVASDLDSITSDTTMRVAESSVRIDRSGKTDPGRPAAAMVSPDNMQSAALAETAESSGSTEAAKRVEAAEHAGPAGSAKPVSNVRDTNTLQVTADVASSTPLHTLVPEKQVAATHPTVSNAANDEVEKPTYSKPYECLIEPLMTIHLGSETQGLIDEVLVDRGEHIKRGQIIARLKSSVEARRVEQAQNRATMNHEMDARTADLRLAELVLERATSLESQQLASSQELDEARALYRVAEAELQQARDTKAQFELDLLVAQALLEQRVVRSPIDGVVIEQNAFAGEVINDKHIVTIAQLSPLRVEVILPLSEYGKYHPGARAMVTQERGGDVIDGYLQIVDPMIDPGSGTFGIRVHIDNAKGSILAGQTCSVSLEVGSEASLTSSFEEF